MAYQKLGFKNGNVLTAEQLIHMEDGIIEAEKKAQGGGTGTGLPSGGDPYMQLVTDGEGKAGWEQRLAWKEGEKVEITWDRNTEGLVSVASGDIGYFYLVSDAIVSERAAKASTATIFVNGNFTEIVTADTWEDLVNGGYVVDNGVVLGNSTIALIREPNTDIKGLVFPQAGVWFADIKNGTAYAASFVSSIETIHPIPAEYLPTTFVPTAIIKSSDYDNALAGVAAAEAAVTFECTNMTFETAYQRYLSGAPLTAIVMDVKNGYTGISPADTIYLDFETNALIIELGSTGFSWAASGITPV